VRRKAPGPPGPRLRTSRSVGEADLWAWVSGASPPRGTRFLTLGGAGCYE